MVTSSDTDTTILMTLTSTTTLTTDTSDTIYISWSKTTLTTQQVIRSAITLSKPQPTTSETKDSTDSITDQSTSSTPSNTNSITSDSTNETSSTKTTKVTTLAPSDYSSRLQFGDIPSSNSSQVGVAIGIPISIFIIFFISLGVWYFLRLKNAKKKSKTIGNTNNNSKSFTFDPFDDLNYNLSKNQQRHAFMNQSSDTLNEKPYPNLFSPTNYLHTAKELEMYQQQQQQQQRQQGYGPRFKNQLNRLSKMWPKRDRQQELSASKIYNQHQQPQPPPQPRDLHLEELQNPQPNLFKRMSMITPIFLKQFNLKSTQNDPSIRPQFINIPISTQSQTIQPQRSCSNQSYYIVIKSYLKNLNDEISINVGEKCIILEKHSDGWCKIKLIKNYISDGELINNNEIEGLVPRMCLQKI
ncbi:FUS1 [Candida jiufengensis]|uniref:FUS1 n=1 Tax=Candida jiufengensis TaxID=497108 RepID=UPI00222408A5|nr:FUS1 [Candida jiufengensis]KAI5951256.1 FUS1 [Candida jiufengensis]